MGRVVANEEFLRALLTHNPYDQYHFYLSSRKQAENLRARLEAEFPELDFRFETRSELPGALKRTRFEVFHLSDWVVGFVPLAALRNRFAKHIFPITGTIHSLSYARYHAEFLNHLWPGCTGRDAIIITSHAGKKVVEQAFDQLRENYRLPENFSQPQLAHIPLGIPFVPNLEDVARWRNEGRKELGLSSDELMLLYLGRINHATKKDMLPLLRMLKRMGSEGVELNNIHLILAGWIDDNDEVESRLRGFAKALGIRLTLRAKPDDKERNRLYASADIFISLVDNLQETFGITLLEAASFGLPTIASDFDGYRDLVVHGKTGYLVPSLGPRETGTCDVLAHAWPDSSFHLLFAQQSAMVVPEAAKYLTRLIGDSGLRLKMGEEGRKRVASMFTWHKLVPQYVDMWSELSQKELPSELSGTRHPAQLSYQKLFSGHFSDQLADQMQLVWSKSGEALYRGKEMPVIYEGIEEIFSLELLGKMMFLARKPVSIGLLAEKLREEGVDGENADYLLLWALKHDFLELAPQAEPAGSGDQS